MSGPSEGAAGSGGGADGRRLAPALLADATWWGTLAAARDLGSRGVSVALASDARVAPARWSRHVARVVPCPSNADPARVLAWLVDFGRRTPGHVLYPTSDELAWLVSEHRETLGAHFRLYAPPLEALASLLDKHCLAQTASRCGLDVPRTWCPADEAELERLAREVSYPVYVKPRMQVFASTHGKGHQASDAASLVSAWRFWRDRVRFPPEIAARVPGIDRPVIQSSYAGSDRIFTVDGFIDDTGELFCTLGCVKVLQLPRGSGPGICFEQAPVPQPIRDGLARLFRSVGFHGIFDAEFIEHEGQRLLIDVNPRFYNHMAFEIDRGMPLPWLAYLGAVGDRAALRAAVDETRRDTGGPSAYVHRLQFGLMLAVQRLGGQMPREEQWRWRDWRGRQGPRASDPARGAADPGPLVGELALEISRFLAHPRAYVLKLAH